ncbi:phosphate ABC transporter substrate-binding/OmpA family protein [Kangiella sp.]|uniref:phosphate ABC transporter substrate-binding/OmpA family protein n=1 Tax=Kangiella sp. TaxID=1920245 RepID=UPI0019C839C1|nr:phosphate ABC transporter substrate-binding/OmpA family protein [Kangiella sp.]MBD3653339.1 substrate-binding domain-containing protein [Kangiella sp.]
MTSLARNLASALLVCALFAQSITAFAEENSSQSFSAGDISKATILFEMKGSNTIGESLAPGLAEEFLKAEGATRTGIVETHAVEKTVLGQFPDGTLKGVDIKAHGSSTGFKALAAEDTDIAMSSRRIKEKEREQMRSLYGDLKSVDSELTIAVDGLAVIVHPQLEMNTLDTETLARIFAGEIRNWQEIGGPNQKISLFARDDNSGTFDTFKSLVLKRHKLSLSEYAKRYESSGELSDMVYNTPGAIGFIGLSYVNDNKPLALSESGVALSFKPNLFTVSTEDYVLSRRLYMYYPSNNTNVHARRFMQFVQQDQAQAVVEKTGLISLKVNDATIRFNRNYPPRYLNMITDSKRLSITFHFDEGTDELDNKAKLDIQRLVKYVQTHQLEDLFLFGFSYESGNEENDKDDSKRLARIIADELEQAGVKPFYVQGYGSKGAIASNSTENGRNKNRRVEVWVGR